MKKLFIEPVSQEIERHLYIVYESDLQSFAKSNFGRELTDTELNRVVYSMVDEEEVRFLIFDFYAAAIRHALEEDGWEVIDNDFLSDN